MMVYVIAAAEGPTKIGIASNPASRLSQLRTGSAYRLALAATFEAGDRMRARAIEVGAHRRLGSRRLSGEWFAVSETDAIEAVEWSIARVDTHDAPAPIHMIDAAQMRAARALLGWTMADLAAKADVALASIKNIERGATDPRASTLRAIQTALETAGIQFVDDGDTRSGGKGVRLKN